MGSGAAHHGGSDSWDEMNPEQKEVYLEQQRQSRIRQAQYEEQERKSKKKKRILIGIGVVIIFIIIILVVRWLAPYFKEGFELGQKIASR